MSEEEIPFQNAEEVPPQEQVQEVQQQQQQPKKKKRLTSGQREKIQRLMVTQIRDQEVKKNKEEGNVTAKEYDVTEVEEPVLINGQYYFKTSWAATDEPPISFAENPQTLKKLCPIYKNKTLKYIKRDIMKKHFHNQGKSFKVVLNEATQNKILQIERRLLAENPERLAIQTNLRPN